MNFFKYTAYNCPRRKVQEDIGKISEHIFGYDIIKKPYCKDMDRRCSYIKVYIEYIPRTGTDVNIVYEPLFLSLLQEKYYNDFVREVSRYLRVASKRNV